MKSRFAIAVLSFALVALHADCKKNSSGIPISPIKNNLAYVYNSDSTNGAAFKSLFQVNGCSVTLVKKSVAATFDYSAFNVIIIDGNTAELNGPDNWSSTDAMAIKNSGKPLVLLNEGGMLFGDQIKTTVCWQNAASNNLAAFNVTDASAVIYKQPKTITIPANHQLTIFSANSKVISFYAPFVPVSNVVLIGQEPGATNANYYPVTLENNKYGLFGFYPNVNTMTATGKDFFINLVYYVGSLTL